MRRRAPLAALVLAAACGIGAHEVSELAPPAPSAGAWSQVFAHPVALEVTALVTGIVEAGPEILIDVGDPRVPAALREKQWVPSIAYLVEHPDGRRVLLDAGVPPVGEDGTCDYGTRPFYWVPCRTEAERSAAAQLRAGGLGRDALTYIVLSHFHGDHAGGLSALTEAFDAPVLVDAREWAAVSRRLRLLHGYERAFVRGDYPVRTVDFDAARPMPYVGPALDLFGDGSVWLIPTPGHTLGSIGAVLNVPPQPLLLTFDASHLKESFALGVPPGFTADREAAVESLERLRNLHDAYPDLRVIYGHEPTQWDTKIWQVTLARGDAPGR